MPLNARGTRVSGFCQKLLEHHTTTTQIKRDTTFATPGYSVFAIIPLRRRKSKIFLSVVVPVVRAAFRPGFKIRRNPATRRVPKPCGLRGFGSWMVREPHPKQARYQLRYTRLLSCFIRLGVFTQIKRDTTFITPGFALLV